ncbi:MAG: hypothetical protein WC977_08120, partial [Anaerovoracaceae bacterium]
ARTISSNIASGYTVQYVAGEETKTLKTITVEACGKTCVVFADAETLGSVDEFTALYDAVKAKTLRQIAQAGTAKITIVTNNGTTDQTKVMELKYQ